MGASGLAGADALLAAGLRYYAERLYDKALEAWTTARNLYEEVGTKRQLGIVGSYIATALAALRQSSSVMAMGFSR